MRTSALKDKDCMLDVIVEIGDKVVLLISITSWQGFFSRIRNSNFFPLAYLENS